MFFSLRNHHLEGLGHPHDGVHVVAIETEDEVATGLGELLLSEGYLEEINHWNSIIFYSNPFTGSVVGFESPEASMWQQDQITS